MNGTDNYSQLEKYIYKLEAELEQEGREHDRCKTCRAAVIKERDALYMVIRKIEGMTLNNVTTVRELLIAALMKKP